MKEKINKIQVTCDRCKTIWDEIDGEKPTILTATVKIETHPVVTFGVSDRELYREYDLCGQCFRRLDDFLNSMLVKNE